jgi:hypothetical protein
LAQEGDPGEDIGFMVDGKIVALRPVEVVSTDYAPQEYGVTPEEMVADEKRITAELKSARERGDLTRFTGREDEVWESRIAHPKNHPRLESFLRESAAEGDQPLDPNRL